VPHFLLEERQPIHWLEVLGWRGEQRPDGRNADKSRNPACRSWPPDNGDESRSSDRCLAEAGQMPFVRGQILHSAAKRAAIAGGEIVERCGESSSPHLLSHCLPDDRSLGDTASLGGQSSRARCMPISAWCSTASTASIGSSGTPPETPFHFGERFRPQITHWYSESLDHGAPPAMNQRSQPEKECVRDSSSQASRG
jgi:hypothetical protein